MKNSRVRSGSVHPMLLFLIAVWTFIAVFTFVAPWYEARTFNKYKSEDQPTATYVDAFFAQLRIQDR